MDLDYIELLKIASSIPIGLFIGLLPGIGVSVTLLVTYFLVINFAPSTLIIFYIGLAVAFQFSNNIAGLRFGVLTDISSIPIIKERDNVIKENQLYLAIHSTALSSTIATIMAFLLVSLSFYVKMNIAWMFNSVVLFAFLAILILGCVFWLENKFYINVGLIICGIVLGIVGYNPILNTTFFTFGQYWLFSGIPILPVVAGMYIFPIIIDNLRNPREIKYVPLVKQDIIFNVKRLVPFSIFGSFIGFLIGLVPLLGYALAPQVTYYLVRKMNTGPIDRINAVEAANNSAAIAVLLPLFIFGIPVVVSEGIMLSILQQNGWLISHITYDFIVTAFVITISIAVACYFLCSVVILRFIKRITLPVLKSIYIFLIIVLTYSIYAVGALQSSETMYLLLFFTFSAIGGSLSKFKISPVPFIFIFVFAEHFLVLMNRLQQLYF